MSAAVSSINVSASSVSKGETLIDTGKTLDALKTDIIIIRQQCAAGAPHLLAKNVKANVINGGDGMNEHPTQALLDMFTMKEHFGKIEGLRVGIFGDIMHSRVARSNILALTKMGAKVKVFGPETLIPQYIEKSGAEKAGSMEELIEGCDVRLNEDSAGKNEKRADTVGEEYEKYYGLTEERLKLVGKIP